MDMFNKQWFDLFRKIVLDHSGILIATDAMSDFGKKISSRMKEIGLDSFSDYHELILSPYDNGNEIRHLIEQIANNETYFFREPAHFRILKTHILPRIVRDRPGKKIRIWSAGCSSGEEAYSLAITLLETAMLIGSIEAEIIGTDIDRDAIRTAQAAIYGRNAFRAIEPYYLNTYFEPLTEPDSDLRQIQPRVRSLVRFDYFNLFQKPYPSYLSQLDVVFFRNVSIYFSKEKIEEINKSISEALVEGGYLFLGSSETLHHNLGNLKLIELDSVYLYQKISQPAEETEEIKSAVNDNPTGKSEPNVFPTHSLARRKPSSKPRPETPKLPTDEDIFTAFKAGNYSQALQWIESLTSPSVFVLMIHAHIYLGMEQFDRSAEILNRLMQMEPLNGEIYFLYGMHYMFQKKYEMAIEYFRQSLFLKKELALAHFHLASIYWLTGKTADAKREYRNTIRILEHHKDISVSFALLGYSSDYLINACRQYLIQ